MRSFAAVLLLLLVAAVPLAFASQSAAAQGLITTSLQGNTLASVNLTTNPFQVQTIFDTPSGAGMAVVQPDGRILYTMPPAGQLGRFDPTTNTNEILVSGFGEPRELTMEPSGTSVLVSDHGGEMIYRINLVNCPPSPGAQCPTTVLVNGPAEGVYNPEGITYDAAGNLYAVFQQQSVRQVDPVSGAILNSYIFPVNNHLEGLTYDTSTNSLWVAARDVNGLYELPLDLSSATPVQQANAGTCQLPTGCIPTANGVISDGAGTLYIAAQGDYHLYQYTIASDTLVQENYIYGVYGLAPTTYDALGLSPLSLSFTYQSGSGTTPQNLAVTSTGAALSFSALASTTPPGGTWLSVTPGSATTPATLTVSVAAGLAIGVYNGQITVASAGAGDSPLTIPVTLTVASSRIKLTSISGWTAGNLVVNAQWTGQPIPPAPNHGKYYLFYAIDACQDSSPCPAVCESPQQEGCTGSGAPQVVAVKRPLWHLLGSGFCPAAGCAGAKGSVAFSDAAINTVPTSAITNWTGTEITFIPSFVSPPFQYKVNTSVSVTITTPDGLVATLPLPTPGGSPAMPGAIATIDGRGYGQCTWYVANQRLAHNLPIPVPAYYAPPSNGGTIDATYIPQQWDVLDFTNLHTAIIKSPVTPTPVTNPDGSMTTTYSFTIGEMNVGACNKTGTCKPSEWSEEPSTVQSKFVVNMSASGVQTIQTEIYSYFCPITTAKCISNNRYATAYFR